MREYVAFSEILMLALGFALVVCSRNPAFFDPPPAVLPQPPEAAPGGLALLPYYERHHATGTQGLPRTKADLLITYDNSGSMSSFNPIIRRDIDALISGLRTRGVDFNIGVFNGAEINTQNDLSFALQGPFPVISTADGSASAHLAANFMTIENGYEGGWREEPLAVLSAAPGLAGNAALFRADAARAYVVQSDALGVMFDHLRFEDVFAEFAALTPTRPWSLSALGAPSSNRCPSAEDGAQPLAEYLAAASSGLMGRICDAGHASFYDALAGSIATLLTELALTPALPAPGESGKSAVIDLRVNGIAVPQDDTNGFHWNPYKGSISFPGNAKPSAGDAIEIEVEVPFA